MRIADLSVKKTKKGPTRDLKNGMAPEKQICVAPRNATESIKFCLGPSIEDVYRAP